MSVSPAGLAHPPPRPAVEHTSVSATSQQHVQNLPSCDHAATSLSCSCHTFKKASDEPTTKHTMAGFMLVRTKQNKVSNDTSGHGDAVSDRDRAWPVWAVFVKNKKYFCADRWATTNCSWVKDPVCGETLLLCSSRQDLHFSCTSEVSQVFAVNGE